MATWHSKDVGDGSQAFEPSRRLHDDFFSLASIGGLSAGIAVFSRYDLRRNVVTWYFSPEAELLAKTYGAIPCAKPTPTEGFGLSVGDMRAWEVHFPGYLNR